MPAQKPCHLTKCHSPGELKNAQEAIKKLEKEITSLKRSYLKEMAILIEEAYMTGYSDAVLDFDKKAEAMEKFLHKSLKELEEEYKKNILAITSQKRVAKKHKK